MTSTSKVGSDEASMRVCMVRLYERQVVFISMAGHEIIIDTNAI